MAAEGSQDLSSPRTMSEEEVAALKVFGADEPDGVEQGRGYVYVMAEVVVLNVTGYYKVGASRDLKERQENLQTGNPRQLLFMQDCRWEVRDMAKAERAAHDAVENYAGTLGGGTEWYNVPADKWGTFITAIKHAVQP